MARFVLASKSPRRQVLLRFLVPDFDVEPVDVEEVAPRALPVPEALEVIARKKALAVNRRDPEAWVLGADTVVHFRGELVGKARSEGEARLRLAMLSGETHEVSTGMALCHDGGSIDAESVTTRVTMARLPPEVVDRYVRGQHWVGKAGGYGIQDALLAPHITIEGPWSNVVGLPLQATADLLRRNDLVCRDPPSEDALSHHNPFEQTPS